jgi:hypothetical protein
MKRIAAILGAAVLALGLSTTSAQATSVPPVGQTYFGSAEAGSHNYPGGILYNEWDVTDAQLPSWYNVTNWVDCFHIGVHEAPNPPFNDGQDWWVCMQPKTPTNPGTGPLTRFFQDLQLWQQTTAPDGSYAQYRISYSPITHKYVYDAFHARP